MFTCPNYNQNLEQASFCQARGLVLGGGALEGGLFQNRAYAAFKYSLRTDSDLGSDATPTLQVFYYFTRSLEENMAATRKAVVAVALAEDKALQNSRL